MCLIYLFFDRVACRILVSPAKDWTCDPQGKPRRNPWATREALPVLSEVRPALA